MSVLGFTWDKNGTMIDTSTGEPYKARQYKVVTLKEFMETPFPPVEYIVDPWLPMRGICMLFAKRGLGKTWVALDIALAAAGGVKALDYWEVPEPRKVLYIDGEMDGAEFKERTARIMEAKGVDNSLDLDILGLTLQEAGMPMLDDPKDQQAIERACSDRDLIIVDNLSSLTTLPENEGESWVPIIHWALRMRARGKSVLFVHHAGKGGLQRGTSRREDQLNTVVKLAEVDDEDKTRTRFEWHFEKNRGFNGTAAQPLICELVDSEMDGAFYWDIGSLQESEDDTLTNLIRQGMTFTDIADELKINKSTVSRRARKLVSDGILEPEELPKHGGKRQ